MASLRIPALRLVARYPSRSALTSTQKRWAQVHDVRFLATTSRQHEVLDKYRSKLDEKAILEGHKSFEDLKAAYADKIAEQRRRDAAAPVIPQAGNTPVKQPNADPDSPFYRGQTDTSQPANSPNIPQAPETPVKQPNADEPPVTSPRPSSPAGEPDIPQAPETPVRQPNADRKASKSDPNSVRPLGDYLDLDKIRDLSEQELTAIWRHRHASSPSTLCAAVPAKTYRAMEEVARASPQFVLPMPHPDQGAEIHFLQWTFDAPSKTASVLFTQLAEYKVRGEFAQPHTTITHHLDLADEKAGLVLMQGQTVDGRGVEPEQAKWLVMCLQKFYGGWDVDAGELTGERKERAEQRKQLLKWFTAGDEKFSIEKLLDEAERMG